jgi:hypothetical protein
MQIDNRQIDKGSPSEKIMTEQQFEARWLENREQRHAEATAVTGKWDQADALLFLESGWTQERIAEKTGKSRPYITQLLCFARFLQCCNCNNHGTEPAQAPIPSNLTEGAFRAAWKKSAGKDENDVPRSENKRFEIVQDILEAEYLLKPHGCSSKRPKAKVAKLLIDNYGDGKWVSKEQILADLEESNIDAVRLRDALYNFKSRTTSPVMVEEKKVKGQELLRIRKIDKPEIRSEKVIHFYEAAMPLLKEAKQLSSADSNMISPSSILHRLVLIERLMKTLYGEVSE